MAEGVDYSWSRPRPWVLASEGKRFAVRYAGPGSSGKHMSRSEVDALAAAGLYIGTVAEGEVKDPLLGRSKGMDHARRAHDMAVRAGMPSTRPIFFAIDWDASMAELERCVPYLDGCAAVLGFYRVGIYGGWRTVDWASRNGHAAKYWQTYAWSGGRVHSRTDLYQYKNGVRMDGGTVDLCRSITADWGQWRPGVETIGQAPTNLPAPDEAHLWDYAPTVDGTGALMEDLASTLEGSARAIEIGWSG